MDTISASVSKPLGLDLDAGCTSLYVADSGNHRVVKHTLGTTNVITVIGTGVAGQFLR